MNRFVHFFSIIFNWLCSQVRLENGEIDHIEAKPLNPRTGTEP